MMLLRRTPWLLALLVVWPPAAACNDAFDTDGEGSVELVARADARLIAADVASVVVTVDGAGMTPIRRTLVRTNGVWQGTIHSIPAGSRTLHGDAFDAGGHLLYAGDATGVAIVENETAYVTILLQQATAPVPFVNTAPRIDAVFASKKTVAPGESVPLGVTAHDPDPTDVLAYEWIATGGVFADAAAAQTSWTAPATVGSYTFTSRVVDSRNAVAEASFQLEVTSAPAPSRPPIIDDVSASPLHVNVGDRTALTVSAHDPDGDPLSYSWGGDCAGTYDDATSATPSFTLTAIPVSSSACSLWVTVTDGGGLADFGTLQLEPGPHPAGCGPVINEVRTDGPGGAGDELVEIGNTCETSFSLAGMSLHYHPAGGTNEQLLVSFPPINLGPRGHPSGYALFVGMHYQGGGSPSGTFGGVQPRLAAAGGGVAIHRSDGSKVDSMGYGTATNPLVEGTVAPAPPSGWSASRTPDLADTNDNAADFRVGPSTPGAANLPSP